MFISAGTHAHYIVYVIKHAQKINKMKWKNTSIDILEIFSLNIFSLNSSSGLSDRVLEEHAPILEIPDLANETISMRPTFSISPLFQEIKD